MDYTKDDLTRVRHAIIRLAGGERVVTVSVAGRTVQYGAASLGELRELESQIAARVEPRRRRKSWRTVTRSGF